MNISKTWDKTIESAHSSFLKKLNKKFAGRKVRVSTLVYTLDYYYDKAKTDGHYSHKWENKIIKVKKVIGKFVGYWEFGFIDDTGKKHWPDMDRDIKIVK